MEVVETSEKVGEITEVGRADNQQTGMGGDKESTAVGDKVHEVTTEK